LRLDQMPCPAEPVWKLKACSVSVADLRKIKKGADMDDLSAPFLQAISSL